MDSTSTSTSGGSTLSPTPLGGLTATSIPKKERKVGDIIMLNTFSDGYISGEWLKNYTCDNGQVFLEVEIKAIKKAKVDVTFE